MSLDFIRVGLHEPVDYHVGMATIVNRTARVLAGESGAVILGQSQPIVTTGDQSSAVSAERAARAGGVTWFGPGVLLISPVVVADVNAVHETLLVAAERTCAEYGIETVRRPHYPGLWVERPIERDGWRKIASIGLTHEGPLVAGGGGLALNVDPDLRAFDDFDACGIPGVVMTSLAAETGRAIPVAEVAERFAAHLTRLLEPAQPVPAHA